MPRNRADPRRFADLSPVDRPGPLRHRVHDALRELIIMRSLEPGQHLVESELARRLNVSRGPVREALQALQAQGWVVLRPGRGAFVHDPSDAEVDEVFAVRAALESEAAGLAATRVDEDDLAELREINARGRAAVTAGAEADVVAENSALHRRIAELSGIGLLCDYIGSVDLRVRWFYKPLVRSRGMASWDEHERLITALEARDTATAAEVMRWHTEQTRRTYRTVSAGEDGSSRHDGAGRRSADAEARR
jgi:DNA-binding GntR family transcriptional regulator